MKRRPIGGFTLAELMMVVAVLAGVMMVAVPLLIHTGRFFWLNRTRVELQRAAREVMDTVTKNLRQAQSSTIVIDRLNVNQPYYSRLSFTTINGLSLTYVMNGTLLQEIRGGKARTLSDDARFVNFYLPKTSDMTIISVSLTFEKAIYQGKTKALHVASERVRVMN